jgi:hypothetical protein
MTPAHPIPWDIYEEHLNESAWLWGNWEQSLDSAVCALGDVAVGPEEYLAQRADGSRLIPLFNTGAPLVSGSKYESTAATRTRAQRRADSISWRRTR